jgi:formylmethanofuran dehydrogenase subunit A
MLEIIKAQLSQRYLSFSLISMLLVGVAYASMTYTQFVEQQRIEVSKAHNHELFQQQSKLED